jgi:hypothetical protein
MYITENIDPIALLTEMLCIETVADTETRLLTRLAHNKDLCPAFKKQALAVLHAYEKHRVDVHDVQGFRDKGCDILIAFDEEGGESRRVGLQIKSHDEISAWWGKKGPSLVATLKGQYVEATQESTVETWYLVLCTDAVQYADAVRHLTETFGGYDRVRIITPARALTFLQLGGDEIEAITARILCRRDLVRLAAVGEIDHLSDVARRCAVDLICLYIEAGPRISDEDLLEVIDANIGEQDLDPGRVVQELDERIIILEDGEYHLVDDVAPAIRALYFDQRIRFSADRGSMAERLKILLELDGPPEPRRRPRRRAR